MSAWACGQGDRQCATSAKMDGKRLLFTRHAIIHESIPASQFNFLCPSLLFAARPFFATFFFRDLRLFSSSIDEGRWRKDRMRRLRKCTASEKDGGRCKDGECPIRQLHGSSQSTQSKPCSCPLAAPANQKSSVLAVHVLHASGFFGRILSETGHIELSAQKRDVKMVILERV